MNVYRATIDNDMYKKEDWMNKYFIQKPVEETEYVSCLKEDDKVIVRIGTFFSCYNQSWGFECDYTYTVYSCGQMKVEIQGKAVQRGKLEPSVLTTYRSHYEKEIKTFRRRCGMVWDLVRVM